MPWSNHLRLKKQEQRLDNDPAGLINSPRGVWLTAQNTCLFHARGRNILQGEEFWTNYKSSKAADDKTVWQRVANKSNTGAKPEQIQQAAVISGTPRHNWTFPRLFLTMNNQTRGTPTRLSLSITVSEHRWGWWVAQWQRSFTDLSAVIHEEDQCCTTCWCYFSTCQKGISHYPLYQRMTCSRQIVSGLYCIISNSSH